MSETSSTTAPTPSEQIQAPLLEIAAINDKTQAITAASKATLELRTLNIKNDGFKPGDEQSSEDITRRSELTKYIEEIAQAWNLNQDEYSQSADEHSDAEFQKLRQSALSSVVRASNRWYEIFTETKGLPFNHGDALKPLYDEAFALKKSINDAKRRFDITTEEILMNDGTETPE